MLTSGSMRIRSVGLCQLVAVWRTLTLVSGKYSEYMQDQFGEHKLDFGDEEWAVIKGSSDL
jgi:hypothetical protein